MQFKATKSTIPGSLEPGTSAVATADLPLTGKDGLYCPLLLRVANSIRTYAAIRQPLMGRE